VKKNLLIGIGFDLHPLRARRKLILGGVEIPYHKGLLGHSDGDVLCHAICDALLSALGESDIGSLFPNSDPQYKNISSLILLREVMGRLRKYKRRVMNLSAVIICQEPKLSLYFQTIKERLSAVLLIPKEKIGLSAKTTENLFFIGKKAAIASLAVVLVGE
jgi:2-C-methyl-D-erythritol 2,4-cyclodiphosphate synthase